MKYKIRLLILSMLTITSACLANNVNITYCDDKEAYSYTNFNVFFPDGTKLPLKIKKGETVGFNTIFPSFRLAIEGIVGNPRMWQTVVRKDKDYGFVFNFPTDQNYFVTSASSRYQISKHQISDNDGTNLSYSVGSSMTTLAQTDKCPDIA